MRESLQMGLKLPMRFSLTWSSSTEAQPSQTGGCESMGVIDKFACSYHRGGKAVKLEEPLNSKTACMALCSETRRGRRLLDESLTSPRANPSRSSSRRGLDAATFPLSDRSTHTLARDVKAVSDAQGRLVRVIEDVSQELSQHLAEHDKQLAEHSLNHSSLRDALHKVQLEENAHHDSLAAEYLRLRSSDGDTSARLTFLESKVVGVEKAHGSLNNRFAELEHSVQRHLPARIHDMQVTHQKHLQDLHQKVLHHVEEQRTEFFQLQGQTSARANSDALLSLQRQLEQQRKDLESRLQALGPDAVVPPLQQHLEKTLLQQLSAQLSSQLHQILQQQLEQHVQPQLERQLEQQVQHHLQAHYAGMQELRDMCRAEAAHRKELASQLKQRLQEQDSNIGKGQEALRQEAAKREQHLADLQDAAQRLAQTAMQRAQASTEAHAHVFSASSTLANRLSVVEGELQSAQRQEKERQQKRIARLEEDLAKSPRVSRDGAGSGVPWLLL